MTSVVSNPSHLFLLWLAWDIGENVDALLKLQKRDFTRQRNKHTKEPEYLVNLPKAKIKRSRKARTEPTLYPETPRFADIVLSGLEPDDNVFGFGYRQALKLMHSTVKKTRATCMPNNARPSWKDLRSGMACHALDDRGFPSYHRHRRAGRGLAYLTEFVRALTPSLRFVRAARKGVGGFRRDQRSVECLQKALRVRCNTQISWFVALTGLSQCAVDDSIQLESALTI